MNQTIVGPSGSKPVIGAGSVDRPDQIDIIRRTGAAGFTIGTSALDGKFPATDTQLEVQLQVITACLEALSQYA